tara:strand:+ start:1931 stop:2245 length:315 start_codon:yes stop_codon:yes gene_type:complete
MTKFCGFRSALGKVGMRVWFNGRTSAFQAEDAGSIPATRSMFMARVRSYGFWQFGVIAHIAQSVEHFLGKEEVIGSNPIVSTRFGECKGLSRCTTKWGRETCIL